MVKAGRFNKSEHVTDRYFILVMTVIVPYLNSLKPKLFT